MRLTKNVSNALGISEDEAKEVINEQVEWCSQKLSKDMLTMEDVEWAMSDMGVETDDIEEFLMMMM